MIMSAATITISTKRATRRHDRPRAAPEFSPQLGLKNYTPFSQLPPLGSVRGAK
jgi:hypothetical protein